MTAPVPTAPTAPPAVPTTELRGELRSGASVVVALAVIGALLGLVWMAWSPPRPPARITDGGRLQAESEQWIAADGRFLVIAAVAGVVTALLAWTRKQQRGTVMLLALAVGNLAGAALMWLVGWATGGGSDHGDATGYVEVTRLTVHVTGLVFLQAGLAVLVYGLLIAFAVRDDLGRSDPARDAALAAHAAAAARFVPMPVPPPPPGQPPYPADERAAPSVRPGDQPQDSGRHGDAPGPLQQ